MTTSDYPDSMKQFYKNISFENYIKVRQYIDPKIKCNKNKTYFALYLYAIHLSNPQYEENYIPQTCCLFQKMKKRKISYNEDVDCSGIYRHIMGDSTFLCMTDLDMLWLCFYATGDAIYPDKVKKCALTKKQTFISDAIVKTAAEWGYNNHVLENYITGPILSNTTTTLTVTDPLFFNPDNKTQADFMEKYKDE